MLPKRLLIANRGEIAIRVFRTAAELGIHTVAVHPDDDAQALHTRKADERLRIPGTGAAAYLDVAALVEAARATGCDALHPGYGFLSESAALARACADAGIVFVGPDAHLLELFGDKVRAKDAALRAGVPVLPGTTGATSLDEAARFLTSLGENRPMIVKALAGGGGRGVRVVQRAEALAPAWARCESEARSAFGDAALYVEELLPRARHIEVQILGDGTGAVTHLGERDCTLQRRHQKLIEMAPSPGMAAGLRLRITAAAVQLAASVRYRNIGTFEFLVDVSSPLHDGTRFAFIEANPRLQVEHTVTEEVTGVDLVAAQLHLAGGATLAAIGLAQEAAPPPRGFAVQVRVNMETMTADGTTLPSGGTLAAFDPPVGHGVRVETLGYTGYRTSPHFDSLLAKVICFSTTQRFDDVLNRVSRALSEFRIEGVPTNVPYLQSLLGRAELRDNAVYTRFIDDFAGELFEATAAGHPRLFFEQAPTATTAPERDTGRAGVKVDADDPLAVLSYGQSVSAARRETGRQPTTIAATPDGAMVVAAPLQGTVVEIAVRRDETVRAGQTLLVMESMKMEHEIKAERAGVVRRIEVAVGEALYPGHALLELEVSDSVDIEAAQEAEVDLDHIRPDLAQVLDRRATTLDENRPAAVARRRAKGQRTARENVMDLCDDGSFVEYGPLVLAAQAARRSLDELIEKSPADGMIIGVGRVNGHLFDEPASRCAVLAYDYTVFAGTQGARNHRKTDRMIELAEQGRMPVVLFAEGGGGRPGDTDGGGGGGVGTFASWPRLSGLVPMIGITSGRCFAGNASVLGCCDVVIATEDSNIGMGGPAMIEGGGLGVFAPEDIGPMSVQVPNGVVDLVAKDEAHAVELGTRYLAYFQGRTRHVTFADQRRMRRIIPENRLRVYDVRKVIDTLADTDSVLELRRAFGVGMITSLVRVEGFPLGIIANNPMHLGGAIDSDGADKAARFMQLCDAFDLPILYLCDTPGIMVGPEVEKTALVRHSSRMFLIGANVSVPFFTIILRKAYGLGAIAMAGGSYRVPLFTVAWPTGEFGGMGLEGSVKLGYRAELAAITDPAERKRRYEAMVAAAYERGKAINNAAVFGIDDTIDPAESRRWVASLLRSLPPPPPRSGKKRPAIDAW